MNGAAEKNAAPVLDALRRQGLSDSSTVVLIGSAARDATHVGSDIDILVLREDDIRIRLDRPGHIHLQQETRSRFLTRLENGDDYPGWALRFGIPIKDPDGWWVEQVNAEQQNPHWPDWRPKVSHASKRITLSRQLLDVGDIEAASEEMMFAASHVARAVLLKKRIFPLSRKELSGQLDSIAPELATLLVRVISGDIDPEGLQCGEALLECYIGHLSNAALGGPSTHV